MNVSGAKNAGIVAVVASIGVYLGATIYHRYLTFKRKGECLIEGATETKSPGGLIPLLGHAVMMGEDPIGLLQSMKEKTSKEGIFGMLLLGNRTFIITDPHSYHLILKPSKVLSFKEFHNTIMTNFFGVSFHSGYDDNLMRKYFSNYLLSTKALSDLTDRMQQFLSKSVVKLQVRIDRVRLRLKLRPRLYKLSTI